MLRDQNSMNFDQWVFISILVPVLVPVPPGLTFDPGRPLNSSDDTISSLLITKVLNCSLKSLWQEIMKRFKRTFLTVGNKGRGYIYIGSSTDVPDLTV